jgi:hypothetical protein
MPDISGQDERALVRPEASSRGLFHLLFSMPTMFVADLARLASVEVRSHAIGARRCTRAVRTPLQHGVDLGAWHTERGAQPVVDAERKRQRTVRIDYDGKASAQIDEDFVSCGGTAADGRILLLMGLPDDLFEIVRQAEKHLESETFTNDHLRMNPAANRFRQNFTFKILFQNSVQRQPPCEMGYVRLPFLPRPSLEYDFEQIV